MHTVTKFDGWCLLFLTALTVGIIFSAIGDSEAGFGAIAYSKATGNYGYSHNYRSREEATWEAERRCGASDCRWMVWFRNSCGALAVSSSGATGYSFDCSSQDQARRIAMQECQRRGPDCRVLCSVCSGSRQHHRRY